MVYNLDKLYEHISELTSTYIYESDKRMLLAQLAIAMEIRGLRRVVQDYIDRPDAPESEKF